MYRTTIRTTPPHTSRRQITPRQAGFFFACVFLEARAAARHGGPGQDQVAGVVVFTVRVNVAACITDPEVAVTVTVVDVGVVVVVPDDGSPVLVCVTGLLLQPTKSVIAATLIGNSMRSLRPRRLLLRTKHSATA